MFSGVCYNACSGSSSNLKCVYTRLPLLQVNIALKNFDEQTVEYQKVVMQVRREKRETEIIVCVCMCVLYADLEIQNKQNTFLTPYFHVFSPHGLFSFTAKAAADVVAKAGHALLESRTRGDNGVEEKGGGSTAAGEAKDDDDKKDKKEQAAEKEQAAREEFRSQFKIPGSLEVAMLARCGGLEAVCALFDSVQTNTPDVQVR